jgi:hypothetical protein
MASAAVAMTAGRRRVRYGRPIRADRTGRDQYTIMSAGSWRRIQSSDGHRVIGREDVAASWCSIAQADGSNALFSCMSGRIRRPDRRQIGLICTQPSGETTNGAAEQNGGSVRVASDEG